MVDDSFTEFAEVAVVTVGVVLDIVVPGVVVDVVVAGVVVVDVSLGVDRVAVVVEVLISVVVGQRLQDCLQRVMPRPFVQNSASSFFRKAHKNDSSLQSSSS